MDTHGHQLRAEIAEQPHSLARLLARRAEVTSAARRIRAFRPEWVAIAARGTSDNAARYAQYLLGAHNRLGVALAVPSLFTVYGAPPRLARALTIGISQSGRSPDVVAVIEEARQQGGATLAISNDPDSPLARAAEACIVLDAGVEKAVAATKTYTAQLLAVAMLSAAIEGDAERWDELERVPERVAQALAGAADAPGLADAASFRGAERFLVVGRGFNYCTAFEVALKMKETSYVLAEPYSPPDLLHGPVAMIDRGFPVIVAAPSGLASGDTGALLDLLESRGARVIALSDRADVLARAEVQLPIPVGVPEWLSPLVAVVPGQLWASALALARGYDPDAPRGLSKVTLTH
jgi:glutamine---fructose-6-phosphate transaminase (isomerizing)